MKYLSLIFLCLSFSSCKKKIPYYPVGQSIKSNFDYQIGSYWVYRDSSTGETDSFYVWQNSDQTLDNTVGNYAYEQIFIVIRLDGKYGISLFSVNLLGNSIEVDYLGFSAQPFFTFPFKVEKYPAGGNDIGSTIAVLNNFILNGYSYSNTAEISHNTYNPAGLIQLIHNDTFYVNSNWIIKMILHHPNDSGYWQNRVLELQRYNLVK